MGWLQTIFFLSGAAGLAYEVVWARLLADILGSTALSMTVVFSVFLVALAVGAAVFGRRRVEGRAALRVYGGLEVAVGISAVLATAILTLCAAQLATASPGPEHFGATLFYGTLVAVLIIGLPTGLMGGTLPMVVAAVRGSALPHDAVARLYGWNTLGAAFGTMSTGFVLIWQLGLLRTLAIAVAINLGVGAAVLMGFVKPAGAHASAEVEPTVTEAVREKISLGGLWLSLAFLSGFAVLAYEILWGRLAKFLLGDRTLAISALLFSFITALGAASLLVGVAGKRIGGRARSDERIVLGVIGSAFLAGSALHLLLLPLADATLHGGGLTAVPGLSGPFFARIASLWILILPPVLVLGVVFPLLAWGASAIDARPARVIGNLYFANTLGAALGAAVASLLLGRITGTYGGFLVVTALVVLVGAALLAQAGGRARFAAPVAVLILAGLALRAPLDLVQLRPDESLIDWQEDEYGVQLLAETHLGYVRVRNNRLSLVFDLGDSQTTHAQQMAAHWSVLLARSAQSVLNLGTGYGITAGTYTLYPSVESIRTVEILPFLVDRQSNFSAFNFGYMHDERVSLVQGDGRHDLAASSQRYDIISTNVLDPYLPGSSSLYTVEFWELVAERLNPGGVFTQLFWGEDLGLLVKGLNRVFPTVLYFPAYGDTSYNLVAFREPVQPDALVVALDRLSPAAAREIARVEGGEVERVLSRLLEQSWRHRTRLNALAERTPGPLHTDDRPVLEYRWAHDVDGVFFLDSPLAQP
jgi:spermidine synthase